MQNGSAIMNQNYAGQPGYPKKVNKIQNDFLRGGKGRGGSPTQFDKAIIDRETGKTLNMNASQYSNENSPRKSMNMIPVRRNNLTTVRVRTKNNSYVYGEQDMDDAPMNMGSSGMGNMNMMDQNELHMIALKKRLTQEKIQKYKEFKLQM